MLIRRLVRRNFAKRIRKMVRYMNQLLDKKYHSAFGIYYVDTVKLYGSYYCTFIFSDYQADRQKRVTVRCEDDVFNFKRSLVKQKRLLLREFIYFMLEGE